MNYAKNQKTLELEVFKENNVGRDFYYKYGFKQIGEHIYKETGHLLLRLKLIN